MKYMVKDVIDMALENGFTHVNSFNVKELTVIPEVLDMCNETCYWYNKNWQCPPAKSLSDQKHSIYEYSVGLLIQTVATLEDEFDIDTINETYQQHERNFYKLLKLIRNKKYIFLALGADTCKLCDKCTYPTEPCRFPELAIAPIESYGLQVSDICHAAGVEYNHGKNTISYNSCILLGEL